MTPDIAAEFNPDIDIQEDARIEERMRTLEEVLPYVEPYIENFMTGEHMKNCPHCRIKKEIEVHKQGKRPEGVKP